ncbi:response regulator transcription factor [Halioxenophilus sp. WMMB6]|uniref:response regulator transcription factor n=1 Tax=Halioxenophilus sp. WMMB6 TaxID=3073815 RepID=UPI00295E6712|nr:response regulator transcription factor [Halioxenophilus sp. WMMB6]
MRLLVVEDDLLLGESLTDAVTAEGYSVDWLQDGQLVVSAMQSGSYDLVVLDQRLPGKSGLEILRQARAENIDLPVLMLTAADAVSDRVSGLDAGADDYLTKPFDFDELMARVRSLLRRNSSKQPTLKAGELTMDPAVHQVFFKGEPVLDLTAKELAILEMLLRNKGRFVTKSRLLESSSNWQEEVESNTIEVYISRLRKRFGNKFIQTMRGVGYRIE